MVYVSYNNKKNCCWCSNQYYYKTSGYDPRSSHEGKCCHNDYKHNDHCPKHDDDHRSGHKKCHHDGNHGGGHDGNHGGDHGGNHGGGHGGNHGGGHGGCKRRRCCWGWVF